MNIDVIYIGGAANNAAPSGFYSAVNYVVNLYDHLFTNNVTVNIEVSYGSVLDPYTNTFQALSSNDLGENFALGIETANYSATRSALLSQNAPGSNILPSISPEPSSYSLYMDSAQAKALGFLSPTDTAIDGSAGFSSSQAWDFTPNTTPAANQYYAVGSIEHEFSEVMGRSSMLNQTNHYSVMDLYRAEAPHVLQTGTSSPSYFSINAGVTNLDNWNNFTTGNTGDLGDWAPSAGPDAYLDNSNPGVINEITNTDIVLMEALGWTTAAQAVASVGAVTDNNAPSVNPGHLVDISVHTALPMTVVGTPTLQLSDGGVAYYTGGAASTTLTFTYMVLPGDNTSDLKVTGLNLPSGATIQEQLVGSVTGDLGLTVNSTTTPATVLEEINGLYVGLYGVAATDPGLQYWISALNTFDPSITTANSTTMAISAPDAQFLGEEFVLTQSTYFNSLYSSLNDSQFVSALYQNLTNSSGSPAGVQYWLGLLQAAEATNGGNVLLARAGLAGQFIHDVMSDDLSVGATALGLTAAEYSALVVGQNTNLNKNSVSLFYAVETGEPAGSILNYTTESSSAFTAAHNVVAAVTNVPGTVSVAITGIANAISGQNLSFV